jgi:hypothetical protein
MSIHIHASPETPPERILYPVNVNCTLALHDFVEPPKVTPQLELFLQLSPIKGEMNRLQYNYLSSVVSERLTLNPHKLIVAKSQTQEQKTERKEASDQGVTTAVVTAQLEPQRTPQSQELPLLTCIYVKIERGNFELKERKTPQENGDEVLAEIAFTNIEYLLENSLHTTVTKVLLDNFTIQCPQHKNSPFSLLVSPLQRIQIKRPTLLVRHQSERIREDIQLLAPSESSVPHSAVPKMWIHLHGVQICWIYFTLSKIQNFFSPTEQNAAESVTEKFKQLLSKYAFQTVHPIAMNWELDVFPSEAS